MKKIAYGKEKLKLLDFILRNLRNRKVLKYIKNDSVILDLGCGFKAELLKSVSAKILKGFGVDLAFSNDIQNEKNLFFLKQNFEYPLTLESEYFDLVINLAVIEHLNNPQNFLKECYRMLKPQGKLFLTTPSIYAKPVLEFLAFKLKIINQTSINDHKRYYSKDSLIQELVNSGFLNKNISVSFFEGGLNLFAIAKK